MHDIDLASFDLNLLVALDAFLSEASVTRAARRLRIGQPAASHALGRLRTMLDDPLLVRSGRSMTLTPRASELVEPVRRVLADVSRLVRRESEFDPKTTTRRFRIMAPDLLAPILPQLTARLGVEAPMARLEVFGRARDEAAALENDQADMALIPPLTDGPSIRTRGLGAVSFSIIARADHPAINGRRKLGKRAWLKYPHIMVRAGGQSQSFIERELASAGMKRRVGLIVPGFLSALVAVAETDMFFAGPRALVKPLIPKLGLAALAPPIRIPNLDIAAVWHERYHAEPFHRFFRNLIGNELAERLR